MASRLLAAAGIRAVEWKGVSGDAYPLSGRVMSPLGLLDAVSVRFVCLVMCCVILTFRHCCSRLHSGEPSVRDACSQKRSVHARRCSA